MHDAFSDDWFGDYATVHVTMRRAAFLPRARRSTETGQGTAGREGARRGTPENTRPGSPERAEHHAGLPSGLRAPRNAGKRARLPASCQFVKKASPPAAAGDSVDYEACSGLLQNLMSRLAPCFKRPETRRTCGDMIDTLLMELEDHNCWAMAEAAGHATPDRMQYYLSRAAVDDAKMADEAAQWTASQLTDGADPASVILVIDDTGDGKSSRDCSAPPGSTAAPWAARDCARSRSPSRSPPRPGTP